MTETISVGGCYCWVGVLEEGEVLAWNLDPQDLGKKPPGKAVSSVGNQLRLELNRTHPAFHIPFNASKAGASDHFILGPAFSSEEDAQEWGNGGEGQRWKEQVRNYVLIGFSLSLPKPGSSAPPG